MPIRQQISLLLEFFRNFAQFFQLFIFDLFGDHALLLELDEPHGVLSEVPEVGLAVVRACFGVERVREGVDDNRAQIVRKALGEALCELEVQQEAYYVDYHALVDYADFFALFVVVDALDVVEGSDTVEEV